MKVVTTNKKAYFNYEIIAKYEAGLALLGSEAKALREGKANLKDSYVEIRDGEAILINSYIGLYSNASINNHLPERERKLLLNKSEILKCDQRVKTKGITIIPLRIYFNNKGLAKIEIALVKGKRLYEKKQKIKDRDIQRDVDRELKYYK
jgi:SsrA-binding protein